MTALFLTRWVFLVVLALLAGAFAWLAGRPGFRSRLSIGDADYFSPSDRDLRIALECKLGYYLTQVAIVMNHLAHREPQAKHFVAMFRRTRGHFVIRGRGAPQGIDELVEKQRDSVRELFLGRARSWSRCDLGFGPRDDLGTLRFEKLV